MRITAAFAVLGLLAGCAGQGRLDLQGADNYAAASALGAELSAGDARALAPAFLQAVDKGAVGERFDWRGDGASGWVKARDWRVGDLKADPNDRPRIPEGLDLSETYETEQGLYALTRNANVRLGASTDFPSREQLISGTGVTVIGKVVGKPWMLVEENGRIAGYVSDSLVVKAPGSELELAGGPRREAVLCRSYEQHLSLGGRSDDFEGVACKRDGRWVLPGEGAAPATM